MIYFITFSKFLQHFHLCIYTMCMNGKMGGTQYFVWNRIAEFFAHSFSFLRIYCQRKLCVSNVLDTADMVLAFFFYRSAFNTLCYDLNLCFKTRHVTFGALATATVYVRLLFAIYLPGTETMDIIRCFCSNRDRLGFFYEDVQIFFWTVQDQSHS